MKYTNKSLHHTGADLWKVLLDKAKCTESILGNEKSNAMSKYLSNDATDYGGRESWLQANLFMISIIHSSKSVSLGHIKRNTV